MDSDVFSDLSVMKKHIRTELIKSFDTVFSTRFPSFSRCQTDLPNAIWRLYCKRVSESFTLFVLLQFSKTNDTFTLEIAFADSECFPFHLPLHSAEELAAFSEVSQRNTVNIRFRAGVFLSKQGDYWWPVAIDDLEQWGTSFSPKDTAFEFVSISDSINRAINVLDGPVRSFLQKIGLSMDAR
jgi:hypothetical protein